MEFVHETSDIIRKYRKSEPGLLVTSRGILLFILVALLGGYFAISTAWMVLDKGIIVSQLKPATIIPVPDVEITFNYHFNIACELRYLDGSPSRPCDEDLVTQPSCDELSEDKRWHGWFTSIDGRVKFNLTENLYGVWFTINIDDPRYQRDLDAGMFVKVHDSDFNPRTVPQSVHDQALKIDPNFYARLDELNYHVNWMFINRHIRKKMIPSFFNVLGIPPSYFEEAYITSRYESVTAPDTVEFAGQPTTGPQKYANLFIGTLNWFEEVETESR
ncbi:14847_t:CDS:2 [Funneliformis caledonium]|uniref:14847_t:CDS:1 n=2 Tax=Funneliformis TaxID=1117308 RepID=A0A9N9DF74_9GLOM|nr:6562_t:CDS:2 [Funneliformis mosseae]CAG8637682.1 14847_t:CDS:2 [Funneliformis caledonium]